MNIIKLLLSISFFFLTNIIVIAQAGSLDQTFGSNGKVVGGNLSGVDNNVAVQDDGKIVVAGTVSGRCAVFRYNANGTTDMTFGTNGSVAVNFNYIGANLCYASAVAVQPDGKIIVGGSTTTPIFSLVNQTDLALIRLNPNGSLDDSFGSGGRIADNVGALDQVKDIVLQPDGKIIITGDGLGRFGIDIYRGTSLFAIRHNADGSLDSAFGQNGYASASFEMISNPPIGGSHTSESLILQPDGKIVVVGTAVVLGSNGTVGGAAIARFFSNGQLDSSFDTDGKVFTLIFDTQENLVKGFQIKSVALQSDGKIIAAGSIGDRDDPSSYDFAVFRYTTTGMLDPSFDGDGKLITSIESGNDYARDVYVQQNGKIVVVGESAVGTDKNFAVARYNSDGSFDLSFNGSGKVITDFGSSSIDSPSRAVLQPDGKIVVVGVSNSNLALARYIGDTPVARRPQFDFDGDGQAEISVFRPSNGVWYQLRSQNNAFYALQFGQSSDKLASADYDGDGKTDIAVFRDVVPGAGDKAYFYIIYSSDNTFHFAQFGTQGDVPMSGDWDGDGTGDFAVYRNASTSGGQSYFFYRPSSASGVDFRSIQWGTMGDKPLMGDFDGDGKLDAAVLRPSTTTWLILKSSDNQYIQQSFGLPTDIPTPADFDGDGKTNIAVFRPSTGFWFTSTNPQLNYGAVQFGAAGDIPTAADYDGDGKADIAVYRPSNGVWYLLQSTAGFTGVQFGAAEDKPIPNVFVP